MQGNLTLQPLNGAELNQTKVQFIPAKIEISTSGKGPVEKYFTNYTEEVDGELSNALRGYPLNGRQFKTPDGLLGIVYEENKLKMSETNRKLKVNCIFDEYTYWNYDKIPSNNDALVKALDWIDMSKSFQRPADIKQLAEFIDSEKKAKSTENEENQSPSSGN